MGGPVCAECLELLSMTDCNDRRRDGRRTITAPENISIEFVSHQLDRVLARLDEIEARPAQEPPSPRQARTVSDPNLPKGFSLTAWPRAA